MRSWQTYYYALVGGIAGLLGWFVATLIEDLFPTTSPSYSPLLINILVWLVLGAAIGSAVCSHEKVQVGDTRNGLKDGLLGLLYGGAGGLLSGLLLPILFEQLGHQAIGRMAGLALFGVAIGAAEGWKWRSWKRAESGALGGALGGICGAVCYELLAGNQSATFAFALASILLGAAIGAGISTVLTISTTAELQVQDVPEHAYKYRYRTFPLDMTRASGDIIGQDPNDSEVTVCIHSDEKMARRHARITKRGQEYFLEKMNLPGVSEDSIRVNDHSVERPVRLENNARIQIAQTVFVFRSKQQENMSTTKRN